ncbi:hypothetical protein ECEPECA12_5334 [Escherichia coli EPECa12]|nr:hypothetical protein CV83906_1338 [Escherichia coli]EHV71196.1 hypothetical protein ECDEC7A_5015 [Escherichia coli DEC7A]EHV83369.1 hypothetical protein ECDEC7C_5060 [Escherichia coli DEC7C]EHV96030.1 hypothetical protein ECDEC7E_4931 [Escherichia coli DEC7E]EHV96491.1 hypothetical protein ECDEC7D_0002 [Escherichia coli DEC7D]EIQ57031.1 hypothetical protein ECEPECA12_5334 [Escherichia coli EPECa12]
MKGTLFIKYSRKKVWKWLKNEQKFGMAIHFIHCRIVHQH